jgi:hypothetical protein
MTPLGKEAEARIMGAIEKTVDLVNAGAAPNSAIIKVAQDAQLKPGEINMLVHAYNTGRTTQQRHDGEDVFEKAADFDLADPSIVLETIYPSKVKTAAEITREVVVSSDYQISPRWALARKAEAEKRAACPAVTPMVPKPAPLPADDAFRIRSAQAIAGQARLDGEEARRVKSAAYDRLVARLDDIGQYFQTIGSVPFGWFRKQAGLLHGQRGEQLCELLAERQPILSKQANDGRVRPSRGPAFELFNAALSQLADFAEKHAAYETLRPELEKKANEALRPFVPARPRSVFSDEPVKSANLWGSPFSQNVAGGYGKSIIDSIANSVSAPNTDAVNSVLKDLTDPQHEADMRNIRLQSNLQDLMTTDPIISGYPSDQVSAGFDEINQMAPRLAEQPAALRAALGKYLQQGRLADFDIDQMLGSENKLKQRDEVPGASFARAGV